MEELLLANPHHHLYHQRYAEVSAIMPHTAVHPLYLLQVCYSQKTVESLEVARKHFALAAKLNSDNMRALYGFYMVSDTTECTLLLLIHMSFVQASHSLSHHPKIKSRDVKSQNSRYCDWARAQIRHKYMQFDTEKLQVVERMLEKTQ